MDSGVETGSVIGGQFDSMLAKLMCTLRPRRGAGARRPGAEQFGEAWRRSSRFHRAVVSDPAFIGDANGFSVHTRWIETEWNNTIRPLPTANLDEDARPRQKVVVESVAVEVSLP